jgi:hypothetical protein
MAISIPTRYELPMPPPPRTPSERRSEAERLVEIARGLLDSPGEEMVALYLDQALETLHMVAEGKPRRSD